jgi:hypothetical protein
MQDVKERSASSSRPARPLADGAPATGWVPARPARRVGAWLLDVVLFIACLGIGWTWWAWHTAARAATPGKAAFGMIVFTIDTRRPASRRRMLLSGLVYHATAVLIGIATLGVGWLYVVGAALGSSRRTIYDEWSQVVVMDRPA